MRSLQNQIPVLLIKLRKSCQNRIPVLLIKLRTIQTKPAQSGDNSDDEVYKSITNMILESTLALQAFQNGQPKAQVLKNLLNVTTYVNRAKSLLGTGIYERLDVQEQNDVDMIEHPVDSEAGILSDDNTDGTSVGVETNTKHISTGILKESTEKDRKGFLPKRNSRTSS